MLRTHKFHWYIINQRLASVVDCIYFLNELNAYAKLLHSTLVGIDFNASLSSSVASCLVSSGYSFVIPRAYQSNGQVDPNVCTSLKNAYNAGVKYRDVYMLPCKRSSAMLLLSMDFDFLKLLPLGPNCSSTASNQMNQMLSYIRTYCPSQWSGRVWLYIEGSQVKNTQFARLNYFSQIFRTRHLYS